jgi:group I intron endonuclease
MKTSCVYQIRNTVSGKIYVGSTADMAKRFRAHRSFLANGTHSNRHLQASWNRHGPDAFVFEVLEQCSPSMLAEREAYWIAKLDSCKKGFNIQHDPAHGNRGITYPPDIVERMRLGRLPIRDETREKQRIAATGRKYPFRPISEAHKEAVRNYRHTDDAKERIAASKRGKKRAPETIEKMREASRIRTKARDTESGRFIPKQPLDGAKP